MGIRVGRFARVKLGGVTVARMGQYAYGGLTTDSLETTDFASTAKDYVPGLIDPGEVSFSGFYDRTDAAGQIALENAFENAEEYSPGGFRLYINSTRYLTMKAGGTAVVTKCKNIGMDKAGVGTVAFTVKFSGAALEVIGN